MLFANFLVPTQALNHISAGQFDMNPARVSSFRLLSRKETFHFDKDMTEVSGFIAVGGCYRISVHGIAAPHDFASFLFHAMKKRWKAFFNLLMTHSGD